MAWLAWEDCSHGWTRRYTDGGGATVIGWEDKMNTDAATRRTYSRLLSR